MDTLLWLNIWPSKRLHEFYVHRMKEIQKSKHSPNILMGEWGSEAIAKWWSRWDSLVIKALLAVQLLEPGGLWSSAGPLIPPQCQSRYGGEDKQHFKGPRWPQTAWVVTTASHHSRSVMLWSHSMWGLNRDASISEAVSYIHMWPCDPVPVNTHCPIIWTQHHVHTMLIAQVEYFLSPKCSKLEFSNIHRCYNIYISIMIILLQFFTYDSYLYILCTQPKS